MKMHSDIKNPLELVRLALARNEVAKLLLGEGVYCYRPARSYAAVHDLGEILETSYNNMEVAELAEFGVRLLDAINGIVDTYEGIDPTVRCVLYEEDRQSSGRKNMGLPLQSIAEKLQKSIRVYASRLLHDYSGEGERYVDGMLGRMRTLNSIVVESGGPCFYPLKY